MTEEYGSHADYIGWVSEAAEARQTMIEEALRVAFASFVETRQVDVIVFSNVGAVDLANAILNYPYVLKPLLAVCNIAARAIERDLQIKNVDTYKPKLTEQHAAAIAGFIKPFLPPYLEIPALSYIDRCAFIDKEIRAGKGRWEQLILVALNRFGSGRFKKRKFISNGEEFELDAATPETGPLKVGIDIKRIEARRDIHKRCDEIVNKAAKLRLAYPGAQFGAVIYYPFIDEHINIQNRLSSENINAVVFASGSNDSIENAVKMLLASLGVYR